MMKNDKELINLIQQAIHGDATALMERCLPYIRKLLRSHIPAQDLDDVVQDVLHKVLRRLNQLSNNHDKFKNWISVLSRNTANDYWRGKYRQLTEDIPKLTEDLETCPVTKSSEQLAIQSEEILGLDCALKNLSPNKETVMRMYYFDGIPTAAIAKKLNQNENTIRRWMMESRTELKKMLS